MHPKYTPKEIRRFWNKVDKSGGPDACWIWMGARNRSGHGGVKIGGSSRGAHRASYEIHYGEIPAGLFVCHACDAPACVNPRHLFLGTPLVNARDRDSRGRNGLAVLTDAQILEIRESYESGKKTQARLAQAYGVSQSHISRIVRAERRQVLSGFSEEQIAKRNRRHASRKKYTSRLKSPFPPGTPDHFWSKVAITNNPDDCWLWTAGRDGRGYGAYSRKRKTLIASRVAYEFSYGSIGEGMHVCHTCDNPPCCNPSHLFLGTPLDNQIDRRKKGKGNRGERNGRCKLSDEQVAEIRCRYSTGKEKVSALAREYGVDRHTVTNIGRGKRRS